MLGLYNRLQQENMDGVFANINNNNFSDIDSDRSLTQHEVTDIFNRILKINVYLQLLTEAEICDRISELNATLCSEDNPREVLIEEFVNTVFGELPA